MKKFVSYMIDIFILGQQLWQCDCLWLCIDERKDGSRYETPVIEEQFGEASRTTVTLFFHKNLSPKSGDKKVAIKSGDKITRKMQEHFDVVLSKMEPGVLYQASEFCDVLGLKISRTKTILKKMTDLEMIEAVGANKNQRYKRK